jgi:hypothetical protein
LLVGDTIDFDQHPGGVAQIAANRRAHRIGRRKALRIYRVVAGEVTGVAEVDGDFDHIEERSAISLENGGDVDGGPLGLLLNRLPDFRWTDLRDPAQSRR